MTDHFAGRTVPASSPSVRRLIAGGFIRRTAANLRLAQLHRQCRADYDGNADRRAQDHRYDAFLIAAASEAAREA